MQPGTPKTNLTQPRFFMLSITLCIGLLALLAMAALISAQTASAYIPGPVPFATPLPTASSASGIDPGIEINFQSSSSAGVADWEPDTGAVYGARGNGLTYGWERDNSGYTFNRNVATSELYDTGIILNDDPNATSGAATKWEIAIKTGWYQVHVIAGDPSVTDSIYSVEVEGVLVTSGRASASTTSVWGTSILRVSDGRLTLRSAVGAYKNRLLHLRIIPVKTPMQYPLGHPVRINFQPAHTERPQGYLVDIGQLYSNRGNSWSYGWSVDNTSWMFDRNASGSPDQRYDTGAYLKKDGVTHNWEIALETGWYWVTIVSGDAMDESFTGAKVSAEGVVAVHYPTVLGSNKWVEGRAQVYVSDGRLTIASSTPHQLNKINFIEISQRSSGNVAMGKYATQSSTHESYSAWRAVDNNTDGALGNGSVSLTSSTAEPYWQVDLGTVYSLSSVTIHPRNSYQSRLSNFYVLVSDNQITYSSLSGARGQAGVSSYYVSGSVTAAQTISIGRSGRYVRIQLAGTSYLQLAEVEVTSKISEAHTWTASSNSSGASTPPSNGLDDITSTQWCTGSNQSPDKYYMVDMKASRSFSALVLSGSGGSTLYPRGYQVFVSSDGNSWGSAIATGSGTGPTVIITFPTQSARYVKIQLTTSESVLWCMTELSVLP